MIEVGEISDSFQADVTHPGETNVQHLKLSNAGKLFYSRIGDLGISEIQRS